MAGADRAPRTESPTADREIVISRVIHAPRELVFEAFSEVRHLSQWWGPDGFTTTTRSFEFREGGAWVFVMHAPDGRDFQEWITWTGIVPPERITLLHGDSPDDPDVFKSTVTFTPLGAATQLEMRTVFPDRAARDRAVQASHAVEGGQQTLAKLGRYVPTLLAAEGR
ncbi:SRPBCC family protein [Nakamurella endophytica]|uniref:Activator of HSP90 ATPase n=1 Tax=Nakamurella endophytica TaxID=1748367 RepID=A0A917TDG7_9ACTN|nr:SRPBCC family protein [Nakamurella endophytica]GGM18881.1 activator of HSP90 ATPase [Nakamurella endophytica]